MPLKVRGGADVVCAERQCLRQASRRLEAAVAPGPYTKLPMAHAQPHSTVHGHVQRYVTAHGCVHAHVHSCTLAHCSPISHDTSAPHDRDASFYCVGLVTMCAVLVVQASWLALRTTLCTLSGARRRLWTSLRRTASRVQRRCRPTDRLPALSLRAELV